LACATYDLFRKAFKYRLKKMSIATNTNDRSSKTINNNSSIFDKRDSKENAIFIKGLKKSFNSLKVLDSIDLVVEKGTVLALVGPNGAGKTTIVNILSTLLLPDGGKASINGYDVVKESSRVRRLIGLTGQYAALDEDLTGKENLFMMGRLYHLTYPYIKKRSHELLQLFDLKEASKRAVKTYSGGMRRRLDLAVSLIASPPVVFLDEPTVGLDPPNRLIMWDTIKKLITDGTTIFLTTQNMDEAEQLADKIIVIDKGKIIAEGTAEYLKQLIGSERLEITIANRSDFQKAIMMVERGEEKYKDNMYSDFENRTISIVVNDNEERVQKLKRVLDIMDEARIDVENILFRNPTLDDVFLALTGHTS
jgi:ABC-2 type transport system ATP-binding protein